MTYATETWRDFLKVRLDAATKNISELVEKLVPELVKVDPTNPALEILNETIPQTKQVSLIL